MKILVHTSHSTEFLLIHNYSLLKKIWWINEFGRFLTGYSLVLVYYIDSGKL